MFLKILFLSISAGVIFRLGVGSFYYNFKYAQILLLLGLFFIFLKDRERLKLNRRNVSTIVLFYVLFLYTAASYLWSPFGLSVLPGAVSFGFGIISVIIGKYYTENGIDLYIQANRILLLSLTLQLVFSMVVNLDASVLSYYLIKSQATTLLGNSNYVSIYITFVLLYELITKKSGWKFYFILGLVGMALTISKAAILSFVLCLILYAFSSVPNKKVKKTKTFFTIVGILGIGYLILTKTLYGQIFTQGILNTVNTGNVAGRDILLQDATKTIADNIFGIGIVTEGDPHNFILNSFRSLGLLFGSFYIIFLISPCFIIFKRKISGLSLETIGLLIAYVSVLVHSMAEAFFFSDISVIWTVITIQVIYKSLGIERQESNIKNNKKRFKFRLFKNKKIVF